jgi:hypothetical protein
MRSVSVKETRRGRGRVGLWGGGRVQNLLHHPILPDIEVCTTPGAVVHYSTSKTNAKRPTDWTTGKGFPARGAAMTRFSHTKMHF